SAEIRSDLYSVAAILFEMLTVHPPFEGETAVDIVVKHMHEKVPSICRIRPDLPAEMDAFIQKAMAKSPADRFSTPQEFITALDQLQQRIQTSPQIERVQPGFKQKQGLPPTVPDAVGNNKRGGYVKPPVVPQKSARLLVISSGQIIPLTGELMVVGRHDPVLGIYPEIN